MIEAIIGSVIAGIILMSIGILFKKNLHEIIRVKLTRHLTHNNIVSICDRDYALRRMVKISDYT